MTTHLVGGEAAILTRSSLSGSHTILPCTANIIVVKLCNAHPQQRPVARLLNFPQRPGFTIPRCPAWRLHRTASLRILCTSPIHAYTHAHPTTGRDNANAVAANALKNSSECSSNRLPCNSFTNMSPRSAPATALSSRLSL